MNYNQVVSSVIDSIGYDSDSGSMVVVFKNGATVTHDGVTTEQHDAFLKSESAGKHYNQHFRSKKEETTIRPEKTMIMKKH